MATATKKRRFAAVPPIVPLNAPGEREVRPPKKKKTPDLLIGSTGQPRPGVDLYDAQGNPRYPGLPPRSATAPPQASAAPATAPAAAAETAPFTGDSEYFADLALKRFARGQKGAELAQAEAYDRDDFAEALRRRAERQPRDIQQARQQANRSGLLFSGTLARNEEDINTSHLRAGADAQLTLDRRRAAREAARAALEQGAPLEEAALFAEAVDRQIERDQGAADAGILAPPAAADVPPKTLAAGATTHTDTTPKTPKKKRKKAKR